MYFTDDCYNRPENADKTNVPESRKSLRQRRRPDGITIRIKTPKRRTGGRLKVCRRFSISAVGLPSEPSRRRHAADQDDDRDHPQNFRQQHADARQYDEPDPDDQPRRITRDGILQIDQPIRHERNQSQAGGDRNRIYRARLSTFDLKKMRGFSSAPPLGR